MDCNKKGSFQNQASLSSDQRRRVNKGAKRTWASHKQTKASKGNPSADVSARWSSSSKPKMHGWRTSGTICESAAKELDSLPAHMPNLPDTDARTLVHRVFYIKVLNGMPCGDAEINVSQVFLVSPKMVRRWRVAQMRQAHRI